MKLLIESWKKFLNEFHETTPSIVTVDFDNTLKMKDTKTGNGPIVKKIKQLTRDGSKIHIVSRRKPSDVYDKDKETNKDYESAEAEINKFIKDYELSIEKIHLTSWTDKWYTIKELRSDMHIDDSEKEWKNIEENLPDVELIKVDRDTGKIIKDLEEIIKKSDDKYCLYSKKKKSKKLGCYPSKAKAKKREKQIQYFKHKKK